MSSGGSSPVVTQTQSKDPWSGAQPYLAQMFQNAQGMQQGNIGYQPYLGQTQAGLDPSLAMALQQQQGIAQSQLAGGYGMGGLTAAQNMLPGIIGSQGITPGIQGALGGLGTAAQQYGNLYSQASGAENPYLQGVINQQMNQVNAAMSGAGRYGSGLHEAAIAQAIAPTLAQDYARRQQEMMTATQGLGQTYGGIADIYGKGLQQAGQYAQLAPSLMQASYLPVQQQAAVGDVLQQRSQDALNQLIGQYNAQQAYPWQQLERESAILAGAGQLGGTTVSGQTTQVPLAQRLLGGALAGGGLGSSFGPVGTGVGALGGGLLGLL